MLRHGGRDMAAAKGALFVLSKEFLLESCLQLVLLPSLVARVSPEGSGERANVWSDEKQGCNK